MTRWVGILNLTPDSFSDGGIISSPDLAVTRCKQLINDGAYRVDVGAESTRPGAILLSHEEEWARLEPFLLALAKTDSNLIPSISIDTRHPQTAARSLEYGVCWINDVSGFNSLDMIKVVKDASCEVVAMHLLSIPADKNITLPPDVDVVEFLCAWGRAKVEQLVSAGIVKERIILDPGIGFGKTAEQSLAILNRIHELKSIGARLLVGHSRKSFLSLNGNATLAERDVATAQYSRKLIKAGVEYIRVHNVKHNKEYCDALGND